MPPFIIAALISYIFNTLVADFAPFDTNPLLAFSPAKIAEVVL